MHALGLQTLCTVFPGTSAWHKQKWLMLYHGGTFGGLKGTFGCGTTQLMGGAAAQQGKSSQRLFRLQKAHKAICWEGLP